MKNIIIIGLLLFTVSLSADELVDDVIECNIASSMASKYQSLRQRFSNVEDALRGSTDPGYTPKEIKAEFFDYCVKALIQRRTNELTL